MRLNTTNSALKAQRVATVGGSLLKAMIEVVADPSDCSRLNVLLFEGTKVRIAPEIEYGGCVYEPVALDPTLVRGVRWPRCPISYGTTRALFDKLLGLITQYIRIEDHCARLLVYFTFSTWFADRLTLAPGLAISGPATSDAIQLLRLLHC